MKIYLLLIDHSRFFFYAEEPAASQDEDNVAEPRTRSPGIRGWLVERYRRFRSAWRHADSGALLWMRLAWEWLHSWTHPDEAMLARLWTARSIDLLHPAAHTGDEVDKIWADYLNKQWWRHLVWMIVNGVIAPFSLVFAILPGPNLIGYWFAYRAVHHTLVVWGISRVQRGSIPTLKHPMAALDLPIERDRNGNVGHSVLSGSAVRLAEHVNWHSSPSGGPPGDQARSNPQPANQDPPIATLRTPETGDHAPIEL